MLHRVYATAMHFLCKLLRSLGDLPSYRGAGIYIGTGTGYAKIVREVRQNTRKSTTVSRLFQEAPQTRWTEAYNCTGQERRTLQHIPIPIAESLNTEGLGAQALQR